MDMHTARVVGPSRWTDKYAWDCSQGGCFSGWRYKTREAAQRAADKHNTEATEADRQAHLRMYGGRPR